MGHARTGARNGGRRALAALGLAVVVGTAAGVAFAASPGPARARPAAPVDVNSASPAQLKMLPGIGDTEAGRIIAGRPYLSKADLVTKQVIPAGIYQSLRGHVIAVQDKKSKAKT